MTTKTRDELSLDAAHLAKALEATKLSRSLWITLLVIVGFVGGAWFGGVRWSEGYRAGVLSTSEGQAAAAAHPKEWGGDVIYLCDSRGRNCILQ